MHDMFCYQCEQTARGTGCTRMGICCKDAEVAALQDLLLHQLKGIGYFGHEVLKRGLGIEEDVSNFVTEALFSTLTNVDFDPARFVQLVKESAEVKERLKGLVPQVGSEAPGAASYRPSESQEEMVADGRSVAAAAGEGVEEDIRSLRDTLLFGMKGMAAYAHHARILGYSEPEVDAFFHRGLAALICDDLTVENLFDLLMEFGKVNLTCMEMLDRANTESYGHPELTQVLVSEKKGPFIVVSGHDLKDLKDLLEQTEGTGVNVYTHGEMLPAGAYPELKKYEHFVGNYGGAWQDQQKDFDGLPGCILMTTNCIQKPRDSYSDRIFTTGLVGWPEVRHIPEEGGKKDFTPVIERALELGGWQEDAEERRITIGFGRHATLSHADAIVDAVKSGDISHFFLIGGCDGARRDRSYYTELAEKLPQDAVILTLGCGKYRLNHLDLGEVAGLPRLLDLGQCNDAYSAIRIAFALADVFDCEVNELPLSLVLSWYEQKAVGILLTLVSLGIRKIRLGPTLPAFISPAVLQVLVDNFEIQPIGEVEEDLSEMLS
ncbi:MAG: hydroxylamine reductase [Bacillota bacterium]